MHLHHRHPSQIPPVWQLPARPLRESPMLFTAFSCEKTAQIDRKNGKSAGIKHRNGQITILQW